MTARVAETQRQAQTAKWAKHGIVGGIIAGAIFALFEMVMAVAQMGGEAFFMPLRMIGGIALGEGALDPTTPLLVAGGAGIVVHMILSAVFGAMVAITAAAIPQLRASTVNLVVFASLAGLALWIVNFYLVAPIAGWRWFPDGTNALVQFVAHTFVFGSVLGLYLDRAVRVR